MNLIFEGNKMKIIKKALVQDPSTIVNTIIENIKKLNPQLDDLQIKNHIKSRLGANYEGIQMVPPANTPQFENFILDLDKGIKATFGDNTKAKI